MKNLFCKMKDESGQALVIVAVSVIVLFGVTAFSVDMGMAYNAKAELQAAADAAALAGAQDLPDATKAINAAKQYAGLNKVEVDNVVPVTPYELNSNQIQVTCTRSFNYLFARVLGFNSTIIRVSAVAEKHLVWGGETLPFLNIDDEVSETGDLITLWEKTGTGDFELLQNKKNNPGYEFTYSGDKKNNTAINCMLKGLDDGAIDIKNGINASIDPEVAQLCDLWSPPNVEFVYVLSLATIPEDPVNYINATSVKENGNVVSASIDLDDIVLLKCRIVSYNLGSAVDRGIILEYLGESINLGAAILDGSYIPGFANSDYRIRLVE